MNCEFCKIQRNHRHMTSFVCVNPKNFVIYQNNVAEGRRNTIGGCPICNGWSGNPPDGSWVDFDPSWIPSEIGNVGYSFGDCHPHGHPPPKRGSIAYMDVQPKVDFNGICDNYKRRKVTRDGIR
jgi:hypothetical protein